MESENNSLYDHNTLEFVTVALEFCSYVEKLGEETLFNFVDKSVKILSLLYLKATLLPVVEVEDDNEAFIEQTVTEEMYESVRKHIALLLGEFDSYLETFHQDMQYSDTPIAACISENIADVYQDMGNFVALYRQGNDEVMQEALIVCENNFKDYWGQQLLNALKALHHIRYSEDLNNEEA